METNSSSAYDPRHSWFQWEKESYGTAAITWMEANTSFLYISTAAYVIFVFSGEAYMKSRDRFDLTRVLIVWNAFLCAASIAVFMRIWDESAYVLNKFGFTYFLCNVKDASGNNVNNNWILLFLSSKFLEFGDTAFIILRKRKLIFLHWFHHVTVPILFWHGILNKVGFGRSCMLMNSAIHSIMYFYFALATAKVHVPKLAVMTLTALQIVQVILGCGVICLGYRQKSIGYDCEFPERIGILALALGLLYLALFCNFFYHSYINTSSPTLKLKKND